MISLKWSPQKLYPLFTQLTATTGGWVFLFYIIGSYFNGLFINSYFCFISNLYINVNGTKII